jgi:hypothetical protein
METLQGKSFCRYLKQTKNVFFFKNGGQEGKIGPVWVLAPVGGERILGKGVEG